MAIRNRWPVPTGFFFLALLAVLVIGVSFIPGLSPASRTTNILHVPADFSTVQAAVDASRPDDIIQVAPGTYVENVRLGKSVTLTAASFDTFNAANNITVLDGAAGEAAILVPPGLQRPPSVHGFVIRNGRYGIDAYSSLIAENNYFYGSQVAIDYRPGAGGTNRDNVYFASLGDAVRVEDMSWPLLLENNRILYPGDDAIELGLPGTAMTAPLEIDVLNNILAGSGQDAIKLVDYATNPRDFERRVIVAGNLIADNHRAGIGIVNGGNTDENYSGANAAESVWVYNNTLYGNDYGISGGENLVAFNNIISNSLSRGAWRVQPTAGGTSVVDDNLFWNNRVDADQTLLGPANLFGQDPRYSGAPAPGLDGCWGTVDDDFSGLLLRPDSPAVDRGVVQLSTVRRDAIPPEPLSGFSGLAPDLGWRESGGTSIATLLPPRGSQARQGPEPLTPSSPTAVTRAATAPAASGVSKVPPLSVESIAPVGVKPMGYVTLTVTGSGFQQGAVVSFEGIEEEAPQVLSSLVVDSNTLQAQVRDVDDDNDTDVWDVRVTNPGGDSVLLPHAFTVAP